MLTRSDLHRYEVKAVDHILQHPQSMLFLDMGLGKEQPVSEPVLTPTGWTPMGSISPGDTVIGSNGRAITVQAVYPQGIKPVYRITLSDGTWVRCGEDHLWSVSTANTRKRKHPNKIKSTKELIEDSYHPNGNSKWAVPNLKPVEFISQDKPLPIEPYSLGVMLGDGTFCVGGGVTICTDLKILQSINATILRPHDTAGYVWYGSVTGISKQINALGLRGHRSWEKFIPPMYFFASVKNRLALLQGLLDTDGSAIVDGGVEFTTTSEELMDGVCELVRSLGCIARNKTSRIPKYQNGNGRRSWRINIKMTTELLPFQLQRKLKNWSPPTKYPPLRQIRKIETEGKEESVCIRVSAPDHLYVTRDYILTHNTISTLTALVDIFNAGVSMGVLVIAPLRVCQTVWAQEIKKWSHTKHLTSALVHGPHHKYRAIGQHKHIYLLNYEGIQWFVNQVEIQFLAKGRSLPFDTIVLDEITRLKNTRDTLYGDDPGSVRGEALLRLLKYVPRRIGLTGTPAPNGLEDLFGQYLVLDGGRRLGTSYLGFRERFFKPAGFGGYKSSITAIGKDHIHRLIADITIQMKGEDYLELPKITENVINIQLPDGLRKAYDKLELEMFLELDSGASIEAVNSLSLMSKCLAEGTEVLTSNGWKPIENYNAQEDLLWDGRCWVNAHSLLVQNYTSVVNCWGVYMTPDHQVLTETGWAEAQDVINGNAGKRINRAKVRLPNRDPQGRIMRQEKESQSNMVSAMYMWKRIHSNRCKSKSKKSTTQKILWMSSWRNCNCRKRFTRFIKSSYRAYLEWNETALSKSKQQRLEKLWRSWNNSMRKMAEISKLLGRYARNSQKRIVLRTKKQFKRIFSKQLPLGIRTETRKQHKGECFNTNPFWKNTSSYGSQKVQVETNNHIQANRTQVERRRPDSTSRVAQTYDIANAGPRHRFTVRGNDGIPFISHNCLQFTNGAIYTTPELPEWEKIHDLKLDALQEIYDSHGQSPLLIGYQYKHDKERILKKFKKLNPVALDSKVKRAEAEEIVIKWNRGEIPMLIGHSASIGHGLNLQFGSNHIVFFGLGYNLELYLQLIGRLSRQGQPEDRVFVHKILCADTLDQAVNDALHTKEATQDDLRESLQNYRIQKNMN